MADEDVDRQERLRRWKDDPEEADTPTEPFPGLEASLELGQTASDEKHPEAAGEEHRASLDAGSPGSVSPEFQAWGDAHPIKRPVAPWIANKSPRKLPPREQADVAALQRSGSPVSPIELPPSMFHPQGHERRSSIGTVASTTSNNTFRSNRTNFSRPRRRPDVLKDIYMSNPKILNSREGENGPAYGFWTVDTAANVKMLLDAVTEPPRKGMFQRVDPEEVLQTHMANSESRTHAPWEQLLACYDVAMRGRSAAFLVLADISKKSLEEEGRGKLEMGLRKAEEEKESLARAVDFLETEKRQRLKEIATLEDENRVLVKDRSALEAYQNKVLTNHEEKLQRLEKKLVRWGENISLPIISLSTSDRRDDEARFESIINALEAAYKITETTDERLRASEEECEDLHKMVSDVKDLRLTQLELQNEELKKQMGSERARVAKREKRHAEILTRLTRDRSQIQELRNVLETERAHAAQTEKDDAVIIARLVSQKEALDQEKALGDVRVKQEVALYRDKCDMLQRSVDELKHKIADQAVEAAREKKEYERKVEEIKNSVEGLQTTVTGGIDGLEGGPLSPGIPQPLLPKEAIHEIKTTQLEAIQASQAAMEQIKAAIRDIVDRVSGDLAATEATHLSEAQEILDELQNLTVSADAWIEQHQTLEHNQGLIHDELDALRQLLQSNQHTFQEIGQQVQHHYAQVQTAKMVPKQGKDTETPSPTFPADKVPSKDLSFGASVEEIECLRASREIILQLRLPLHKKKTSTAFEMLVNSRIDMLHQLWQRLSDVDPNTPAEDLIIELETTLKSYQAYGIEKDLAGFETMLEHFDSLFEGLLKLKQYSTQPRKAERELLRGIHSKIEQLEKNRDILATLATEHEAYRTEQSLRSLNSRQWGEVLLLTNNFLEANGDVWSLPTATREEGTAAWETLVSQVQERMADAHLAQRRREIREIMMDQDSRLMALSTEIPKVKGRADGLTKRVAAFDRVQLRGFRSSASKVKPMDLTLRAALKRHETRLRREYQFSTARLQMLDADQVQTQDYLSGAAAAERQNARESVTRALLQLQASRGKGRHGEATCFCTLFRYFFPRGYYSVITGGCCAGGKTSTYSPSAAFCQGHHGHGTLISSDPLWSSLCRLLTSITWLLFLVFYQPSELRRTVSFFLSSLAALPIYLFRLTKHTYTRIRHWISPPTVDPTPPSPQPPSQPPSQLPSPIPIPQPPTLTPIPTPPTNTTNPKPPIFPLPPLPTASTLVSTTLLLATAYLWLTYVAVTVERRIWVGSNDWRFAYVRDLTSGRPPPYPGRSPVSVDYRLAVDPAWVWFAERVHGLFGWARGVDLGEGGNDGVGGVWGAVGGLVGGLVGRAEGVVS